MTNMSGQANYMQLICYWDVTNIVSQKNITNIVIRKTSAHLFYAFQLVFCFGVYYLDNYKKEIGTSRSIV